MPCFKYYKRRQTQPSFENVIDFSGKEEPVGCSYTKITPSHQANTLGLDTSSPWRLFEIDCVPGLYFLPNPFTNDGQVRWSRRCLDEYSKPPNKMNVDINQNIEICQESLWNRTRELIESKTDQNQVFNQKAQLELFKSSPIWSLRWTTLGYHHNWNTKVYNEDDKCKFPSQLHQLSRVFGSLVGYQHYDAQAAIVNFYHVGSTLSAHTDSSEYDLTFPLISVSFGLSAIFLIGGETKETEPKAIFIRSGDVVIMTKQSRLSYHAVPRILSSSEDTQTTKFSYQTDDPVEMYLTNSRINMNVRQLKS